MPNYMRYDPAWWQQYRAVNQRFADKAFELAGPGDLVWVHDYQLMLVPAMLHDAMPELKIGFFLHTPLPSFETFRCHPKRSELVAGMLGADLIGFHTFGYMRHFRSTVLRLLGIESEITQIRTGTGHRWPRSAFFSDRD
jgi:trehalose 6-phosphate synthase/phosphatase